MSVYPVFAVVAVLLAVGQVSHGGGARPLVRAIGPEAQLFVDDWLVASKRGVRRTLHPCTKLDRPVIVPDKPWEGQRVYVYGSASHDPARKEFRLWYMARCGRRRVTGLATPSGDVVCLATSKDGVHWQKPSLGLYAFDGSSENNIVWDYHSPSVVIDEAEPDPARRYKMAGAYHPKGRRGYWGAHSPDGLRWTHYPVNPILPSTDTITATRVPWTGEYLAFHKHSARVRGVGRRTVWLAASRDFQAWSKPKLLFAPDEQDDAWAAEPHQRTEFYVMSAFPYGRMMLGLLSVFRLTRIHKEPKPHQSPHDGPIDIQLVHSRDGHTWHRFEDRSPLIPTGPHPYDAGCILGVANGPVLARDEMWVYYTAITTPHGGALPAKRITIGRAAWRRDGFVSLDAGPEAGVVETVLLTAKGTRLEVNADASKGSLAVEVLTADGKPLPGFSRADCQAVHTDSVRHAIRWQGGARLPADRSVRLRFHLTRVGLYSFRIAP